MTKKNFEILAILILGLGLLWVPGKTCYPDGCDPDNWDLIFLMGNEVDFARLLLQEGALALALLAIWKYKFT
jgi:hypothetical protein